MKGNKKINIGLLVNSIQNDYSTLLCKGAAISAEELCVNLLIVPGRELNYTWDNIEINRYEYQNNVLYSFVTEKNIDVLLVSLGTVGFFLSPEEKKEFLDRYSGIKTVAMESEIDGYPSIVFGNEGLREEIEHLIKVHGKRKIAFVGGPETNSVANERLKLFRDVMKENNLEVCEDYIVHGDFTDYCDAVVEELFDKNSGNIPEAVCCANDSMVIPVKRACRKRGLVLGKDVLVTGYDDAVFANVMDPPLTTVKSNIMSMGYQAVRNAVNYFFTGHMEKTFVKTSLIVRQSCGCDAESVRLAETKEIHSGLDKNQIVKNISAYALKKSALDIIPKEQVNAIEKFTADVYEILSSVQKFTYKEASAMVSQLMSEENMNFLTFDTVNALMFGLKKIAFEIFDDEDGDVVFSVFERFFRCISLQFAEESHNIEKRMVSDRYVFARIADDMMDSGNNEVECFRHLMDDIAHLNVRSCYIYLYHNSFLDFQNVPCEEKAEKWRRPQNIYLKAVYDDGKCVIPPADEQCMSYDEFLTHKFIPFSHRRTMILQALYFNDEQYGVMLVETDAGVMSEVMNISRQICTAIKLTQFMNQLEGALEDVRKANIRLVAESVSDQMTGVYNRRGFIKESEKILCRCKGSHHKGAVLYADLDCLKMINDTFGHKEGDFAIRKISGLLAENLRPEDVVGRVGGDEFVAFLIDTDEQQINDICQNIKNCADSFNKTSDKPYNIGVSMGVYFFDTFDEENIDQLMSGADGNLYINKKGKNRNILKCSVSVVIQNKISGERYG